MAFRQDPAPATRTVTATATATATSNTMARFCKYYRHLFKIAVLILMVQLIYSVVSRSLKIPPPVLKSFGETQNPSNQRASFNEIHKPTNNVNISLSGSRPTPSGNETSLIHGVEGNSSHVNTTIITMTTNFTAEMIAAAKFQEIMDNVTRMFSMPRRPNQTSIDEFKKHLKSSVHTHDMFILSQTTVNRGDALHFAINVDRNQVISDHLYNSLPKESPYKNTSYKRCSVVGNGGILLGSKCGTDIDKAEYIFRCNSPPLEQFASDAGNKSNITTLNQSIAWKRFHNIHSPSDKTKFLKAMQANRAAIFLPLFGTKSAYSTGRHITRVMNTAKNPPIQTLIGHPKHWAATQEFWKRRGITNRMSTGFYLTSVAISLCDDVHLYGFWPFSKDLNQNNLTYHYYNKEKLTDSVVEVHDLPSEFEEILHLHQEGVIKLHILPCKNSTDVG